MREWSIQKRGSIWREITLAADPEQAVTEEEITDLATSTEGIAVLDSLWRACQAADGRAEPTDDEIRAAIRDASEVAQQIDDDFAVLTDQDVEEILAESNARAIANAVWAACLRHTSPPAEDEG